jgi:hypothetical protein
LDLASADVGGDVREFKVGVFEYAGTRVVKLTSYTMWYSPEWTHCCEHLVWTESGKLAKKAAEKQHRERCMTSPRSGKFVVIDGGLTPAAPGPPVGSLGVGR